VEIIKRGTGIFMLEQYGNKYIRFDAGQICQVILQIKITEEEFNKVKNEEISMGSVVSYYQNQKQYSEDDIRKNLMKDYLRSVKDYSEKLLNKFVDTLATHRDIFIEFYDYVLYEEFTESAIKVEGYTAEYLHKNYPLSPLGAYNYLISLREQPEKALEDLKKGLPRK